VGATTPRTFAARIKELVRQHPTLGVIADALLAARGVLAGELQGLERRVHRLARDDARARLLMSTPGVGAIVALTYVAAIDDPGRLRSSKAAGAQFGLTPKRYQLGETDITGRISKAGDAGVRAVLYEAAHVILTRPIKGSTLKSWAMRVGPPAPRCARPRWRSLAALGGDRSYASIGIGAIAVRRERVVRFPRRGRYATRCARSSSSCWRRRSRPRWAGTL
jgi:transposase